MLDLTDLRKDEKTLKAAILKKEPSFNVEELLTLDDTFRKLSLSIESLRQEKNNLAKQAKSGITTELRNKSIEIGKQLKQQEDMSQWHPY